MLVLTRESQQLVAVTLPDGRVGWVSVCRIYANAAKVKLGFDFPRDVKVRREEVPDEPCEHAPPTVFGSPVADSLRLLDLYREWRPLHAIADDPSTSTQEACDAATQAEKRLASALRGLPDGATGRSVRRDVRFLTPDGYIIGAASDERLTWTLASMDGLILLPPDCGGPS